MSTARQRKVAADYDVLVARWRELTDPELNSPSDPDVQAEMRQVRDRIRKAQRCVHDCPIVEIDVPPHSATYSGSVAIEPSPFRIANAAGERTYLGHTTVPRCIAHQLLSMISRDRETDQKRMVAGGNRVELRENARISDLARQIAAS